jgi:signal peptidase II
MQERGAVVAALSEHADRSAQPALGRRGGRRRLISTLLIAAAVVAADQITKSLAVADLHRPVHVVGPFGLSLAFNSGAAFSLFTGATIVIVVIALAVLAILGFIAWRSAGRAQSVGLGLILGGALGNLSDRAFRGHHGSVVDFITLTHWPTFNVADSCITVGALVVVVVNLRPARGTRPT